MKVIFLYLLIGPSQNLKVTMTNNSVTILSYEAGLSISYKIACAPSEDSAQPAQLRSLIGVFAVRSMPIA